jgi:hypothetical protein
MTVDLAALKSRLSNPHEVARLLGLKVLGRQPRGVVTACPAHGNKSGSLSLTVGDDGTLQAVCFGCGLGRQRGGDVFTLLEAIEGDFKRALARAQEMAGGAVGATYEPEPARERLPSEVYHDLATRILETGRLDGRAWVRDVEEYLARRRLLELARADGWACLPGLNWLLSIAKEVCDDEIGSNGKGNGVGDASGGHGHDNQGACANDSKGNRRLCEATGVVRDTKRIELTPHDMLIRADLARWNDRGEFVSKFGRWRLVIPWRAPDGRITCLQRRRTWAHEGDGPEPAKYVFPFWKPDWPYGSDRLCIGQDRKEIGYGMSSGGDEQKSNGVVGRIHKTTSTAFGVDKAHRTDSGHLGQRSTVSGKSSIGSNTSSERTIAICEGAADVLAMRAMHPSFDALGLPGITNWRPEWAALIKGDWRICLDRGKPDQRGLIPEDMASARIALDLAGGEQERERVIEWWVSRHRRGRALGCVLCGAPEPWLCRGCGRRRAKGKDWAEDWANAR